MTLSLPYAITKHGLTLPDAVAARLSEAFWDDAKYRDETLVPPKFGFRDIKTDDCIVEALGPDVQPSDDPAWPKGARLAFSGGHHRRARVLDNNGSDAFVNALTLIDCRALRGRKADNKHPDQCQFQGTDGLSEPTLIWRGRYEGEDCQVFFDRYQAEHTIYAYKPKYKSESYIQFIATLHGWIVGAEFDAPIIIKLDDSAGSGFRGSTVKVCECVFKRKIVVQGGEFADIAHNFDASCVFAIDPRTT